MRETDFMHYSPVVSIDGPLRLSYYSDHKQLQTRRGSGLAAVVAGEGDYRCSATTAAHHTPMVLVIVQLAVSESVVEHVPRRSQFSIDNRTRLQ